MRFVIQRTSRAGVEIDGRPHASIGPGVLVLVGIVDDDGEEDLRWMASKLVNLRIFDDADGVMNLGLKDTGGDVLLVSQFTLHALTRKGNRPSYIRAARPETAVPIYERLIGEIEELLGKKISTGLFGADMKVSLINDGPVTILLDSKNKE